MVAKIKRRRQILKGSHGGMQLVLTEDIPNLGKQGDVVEVKAGYGRNYLVPRGLATAPTPHNLKLLDRYKIKVKQAREARMADLRNLAEQILKMPGITIEVNARPGDTPDAPQHLYGSVGAAEIVKGLYGKGLTIEPEMVKLEEPIKETGLWGVKLNLGFDIETEVKVLVTPGDKK